MRRVFVVKKSKTVFNFRLTPKNYLVKCFWEKMGVIAILVYMALILVGNWQTLLYYFTTIHIKKNVWLFFSDKVHR